MLCWSLCMCREGDDAGECGMDKGIGIVWRFRSMLLKDIDSGIWRFGDALRSENGFLGEWNLHGYHRYTFDSETIPEC